MSLSLILPWIRELLQSNKAPFLLGINGPQGAGKSTLAAAIKEKLATEGVQTAVLSIDDFYLTREQQVELANQHPENPYLQQRGYPGTHDVSLGTEVLLKLKNSPRDSVVVLPCYDKSAHQGRGDRRPRAEWPEVVNPHLIIFEGWMLGFTPVAAERLPNRYFDVVNHKLAAYKAWHELLDGFLQLKPDDYRHVLTWRVEAEEKMKNSGKAGMSKEEVSRYIGLFLPAYETYLPGLDTCPPVKTNRLVVNIGRARLSLD